MFREKTCCHDFRDKNGWFYKAEEKKKVMEDRSRHSVVLGGWIGRPVNSVKVELECLSSGKKKK